MQVQIAIATLAIFTAIAYARRDAIGRVSFKSAGAKRSFAEELNRLPKMTPTNADYNARCQRDAYPTF